MSGDDRSEEVDPGTTPAIGTLDEVAAWAAGGTMALTGRADGPALGPPAGLVQKLTDLADRLAAGTDLLGRRVQLDPLTLLAERAAISGFTRHGAISCGGATRLLTTLDGWIAASLARPDDIDLVPAWLELDHAPDDPWAAVTRAAAARSTTDVVHRAALLGLPVSSLPSTIPDAPAAPDPLAGLPLRTSSIGTRDPVTTLESVRVLDLSSLWAGPLCGSLLAAAGAQVVKLESTHRPDGARRGPVEFFDLLNGGKRSVALDLRSGAGRRTLGELIRSADVVIEASRPRALEQLGVDAAEVLSGGRTRVWASITGHARQGAGRDRVAFGDDAAVAGGLVVWDDHGPCFCADAIADPTSGLVAATAIVEALRAGGHWLLDVAMSGVAAHLAGPTLPVPPGIAARAVRPRAATASGPGLGQHTDEVLAEWGIG